MLPLKWVEIDLDAVASNAKWVRSRLKPGTRFMAVVKADAYGHGAAPVAKAVLKAGADLLGVLTTSEAAALRRSGIKAPIQVLSPLLPANAGEVLALRLVPTIDDLAQARALNARAGSARIPVHLDLDFGLGRWGILPKDLPEFLRALERFPGLRLAGISTHIDYLPGKNAVEAEEKLRAFAGAAQALKRRLPDLCCHAANSSVLMDFPHWQMDQVRVGNLLYGINPTRARASRLKNPWSFKARIIALRRMAKGSSIGYASEYVAPRGMTVATVAAGYSDGLTMEPAERLISFGPGFQYWGMLKASKTPFVGRCGISHVLLDVSNVPDAKVGDCVALPVRRTAASAHLPRVYV
ncbi:MAG: alanine racemase [Elusimicrobia bacterium]|nr:alanine racemase [Elusimicrobiota bacterium]